MDTHKRPIGGFLGLEELTLTPQHSVLPGIMLASGRACLMAILENERPKKIHLPFFTCDSVIRSCEQMNVEISFYDLTEELLPRKIMSSNGEMTLLINYFSCLSERLKTFIEQDPARTIIDNTQALFELNLGAAYSFNSLRKFLGVPDGGMLTSTLPIPEPTSRNDRHLLDHLILRKLGYDQEAYSHYRKNEQNIAYAVRKASHVSERMLKHIDLHAVREIRERNFKYVHQRFNSTNQLRLDDDPCGPMAYPLLLDRPVELSKFHEAGLYIPKLWQDVKGRSEADQFPFECGLVDRLLPLPIDQRYALDDIDDMCDRIEELLLPTFS